MSFNALPPSSPATRSCILQEAATPALLFASKYGIARVLERYASHVGEVLLPGMSMADALGWLNLLCRTQPPGHKPIDRIVDWCEETMSSDWHSASEAAAYLAVHTGTHIHASTYTRRLLRFTP